MNVIVDDLEDSVLYTFREAAPTLLQRPTFPTKGNRIFEFEPASMLKFQHATLGEIMDEDGDPAIRQFFNMLLSPGARHYSFWVVDTERERTSPAMEEVPHGTKRFWVGLDCYVEVYSDLDLEPKDPNVPLVASAFAFV